MSIIYAELIEQYGAPTLASGTLAGVATARGSGKRVVTASATLLATCEAASSTYTIRAGRGVASASAALIAKPSLKTRCYGTALGRATARATPSRIKEIAAIDKCEAVATVLLRNYDTATFMGAGALIEVVGDTSVEQLPVEVRLRRPFPYPALEECRQRALSAVTGSTDPVVQARTLLVMAYSTELKSAFIRLLNAPAEKVVIPTPGKNKAVEIDRDLHVLALRYPQVFLELRQLRMPNAYQDLIEKRLTSTSFNHRVSAMCAMLVLVAALLLDDEAHA